MLHQAVDVVLVEEGRLPAVRLGIVAPPGLGHVAQLDRVVGRPPAAVGEPWPCEADRAVDDVAPVARALEQAVGLRRLAGGAGEVRRGPVVIRIFLRTADAFEQLVGGHVAHRVVEVAALAVVEVGRREVERAFGDAGPGGGVIGLDALLLRLGEDGDGVPADHRARLDALQRPARRAVGACCVWRMRSATRLCALSGATMVSSGWSARYVSHSEKVL